MSGQPAAPTDAVSDRSALPRVPGMPWWAAVLIALIFTAIGFAFDAGANDKELGGAFATCYVLGCLLAVLTVKQSAVFTAVIQPPLILFFAVPSAYFVFHSAEIGGIKDILINCGYPLIERFPLMFFTSAVVLIIGMVRWYIGATQKRLWPEKPAATHVAAAAAAPSAGRAARRFAKTSAADAQTPPEEEPRRGPAKRPSREASGTRRSGRPAEPSRARHTRPPENDIAASAAAADRRERMAARERPVRNRREGEPPLDRRPRRPRPPNAEPRHTPYDQPEYFERPRRPAPEGYEPRYDERRPPVDNSHHPVSRVRYRSSDEDYR